MWKTHQEFCKKNVHILGYIDNVSHYICNYVHRKTEKESNIIYINSIMEEINEGTTKENSEACN